MLQRSVVSIKVKAIVPDLYNDNRVTQSTGGGLDGGGVGSTVIGGKEQ